MSAGGRERQWSRKQWCSIPKRSPKEYSLDFVKNGNENRCFLFPLKIKIEVRNIHVRLDTWSQRLLQRYWQGEKKKKTIDVSSLFSS